ncbi:aspartate aminotransferase family protein [Acidithiobacillus thiooxidans]|uniref:Beta-alanine--pyruvate aminotransferase n=1 Tax=Acidithiobacillus thiooxidans ATCC 19377 TaxID=637390 RepID=A0A543Q023_ACITH|nr:aspartate aminotransferase family protein [Acidithiobacillus thiooxidans]MDX5936356.1 aspartate aminotransferase family protein [Acidithiobacillus thiooxidans]TQN49640.1 Beta-alanine--pyruvate aminotransferase [Acidithiobacillus thiooxidans ATCC 19377]
MSPYEELDAFWMPFTANRQFKSLPRMLERAEGMFYWDREGKEILDSTAGLWCVNAGHCRREISDAITAQTKKMDFAPTFQMGHSLPFSFANRLIKHTPEGLDHVFFTNSGSESVDTALKMALAYHFVRGESQRTLLIGREKAYHGVGFGGISVGGLPNNRRAYANLLATDHLPHTLDQERNRFSQGLPPYGAEKADALEQLIENHGAEHIAAVIVEPVAGSAGVIIPPAGYLQRLREICTKNGILLIFDEVITGFGRLGTPFAADYFAVTPDIMTSAKGLTNAAVPMGAVICSNTVHDAYMNGPNEQIEFFHGYTYSGHPLACVAGLAALDIYEEENLLYRGSQMAEPFAEMIHSLRDLPHVADIRNIGLMGAIELKTRSGEPGARGYEVLCKALERGLLIRATGDTIALSPPLIIELKHLDRLFQTLREVMRTIS